MSKVFIIGGPGNISRGTLDTLLERGDNLAIYTRGAASKRQAHPEVAFYEGDRKDAESLRRAFNDFGADLLIDTICFEPQEAQSLYEITRGRIRHLLFISTVDVYGYPLSRLPFREQDEFHPAIGDYAQKKRAIECFYKDKWQTEGFPVTIGRPSLSIGPDFCPMMFWDWGLRTVPKMKAGLPILVPGDGNALMHVGWGYDVGRMAGRIIGEEKALGKSYTLSAENCLTRDEYISLYSKVLGVDPKRVYIPQEYIERYPGVADIPKIAHLYRVNMAYSLENFMQDFPDYRWMPLRRGVEEFIEVNQRRGMFLPADVEIIEDKIIRDWKERLAGW
jgi:nucleoside-diphosphate-sugar epimerase